MATVAVMGATGAVGRELLATLERRRFPVEALRLLASERSTGGRMTFRGEDHAVELLTENAFEGVDLVLASAGASVSRRFAPAAVEAGAVVVDNTSAFRMEPGVPLVVPEINAGRVAEHRGIVANPNCSTILMLMAVAPIHRAVGVKRIVVSTYQAASGAGQAAMEELLEHTRLVLASQATPPARRFAHSLAFNCLPHIDVFLDNGYTREEMKMVHETRKILEDETIGVTSTTIRVPVLRCHSASINLETRRKLAPEAARRLLETAAGVVVADDPTRHLYPMATTVQGRDEVFVGRIREDESIPNGLNLWVVGDQLLKGAALNAVQIAEILLKQGLPARGRREGVPSL